MVDEGARNKKIEESGSMRVLYRRERLGIRQWCCEIIIKKSNTKNKKLYLVEQNGFVGGLTHNKTTRLRSDGRYPAYVVGMRKIHKKLKKMKERGFTDEYPEDS